MRTHSLALAAALVALLGACHRGSASLITTRGRLDETGLGSFTPVPMPVGETVRGTWLADSSWFHARVVAVDQPNRAATLALDVPAFVLVLGVTPGKAIVPIMSRMLDAGVFAVDVQVPVTQTAGPSPQKAREDSYNTCVANTSRARFRPPPPVARAVNDSTGRAAARAAVEQRNAEMDARDEALRAGQSECQHLLAGGVQQAPERTTMQPWNGAYLLVVAADRPIDRVRGRRLAKFSVKAEDGPATVQAVADGLHAMVDGKWSASYVSWQRRASAASR